MLYRTPLKKTEVPFDNIARIMLTDGLAEISKGNVSRNEMRVAKKGKKA
jgi:hypothetical protein